MSTNLSLSSIVESLSPTRMSLINIIDRVEKERIGKLTTLQSLQVGSKVSYRGKAGVITEVSAKFTSVVVNFDGKKRRFFMNKRKGVKTINELRTK
jgi:hypothetical protein